MIGFPDGLCVSSTVNALSLKVNWDVVPGALSYNLYRSPIPHDSFARVASSIPGLTYFDNPQSDAWTLNLSNLWCYKVSAVDGNGEGPLSPPSTYLPYEQLISTQKPMPGLSWWGLLD